MLFGHFFRLKTATLGIAVINGQRRFITVHPGSVVKVVSRCADGPNAMVEVLVEGSVVEMFAVDVRRRGDEVSGVTS